MSGDKLHDDGNYRFKVQKGGQTIGGKMGAGFRFVASITNAVKSS